MKNSELIKAIANDTEDTQYNALYPSALLFEYLRQVPLSSIQIDRAVSIISILEYHYLKTEGWYTIKELQQEAFKRFDAVTAVYSGETDPICEMENLYKLLEETK